MGKETWQVLYGLQTIILIIMAAFTVTNHTQVRQHNYFATDGREQPHLLACRYAASYEYFPS